MTPATPAKLRQRAEEHFSQGEYALAIDLYCRVLEGDSPRGEDFWYLGVSYLLVGEEEQAREVWFAGITAVAATDEEVDRLVALLQREGNRHLSARQFALALALYQPILELNRASLPAYLGLASALSQRGQFDEAIALLDQSLTVDPTWAAALLQRGTIQQILALWPEAIASFTQVVTLAPRQEEARYRLAQCQIQQEQWQDALLHLTQVLEQNPQFSQAWGEMGWVYLQLGQIHDGIACFRQMAQCQPQFVQTYCRWVADPSIDRRADDPTFTNAALLAALIAPVPAPDADLQVGKLFARRRNWETAIAPLQRAMAHPALTTEAHLELGRVLAELGRLEEAIATYEQGIQICPDRTDALVALAQLRLRTADVEGAIACCYTALERDPDLLPAQVLLATAHRLKGDWETVLRYGEAALVQDASSIEAQVNLAIAHAHLGNAVLTGTTLAHLLQQQPDLAALVFRILQDLGQQGILNLADPGLQPLMPVDPPSAIYGTTGEWVQSHPEARSVELYPATFLPLTPPQSLTAEIHPSFRFGDGVPLPGAFVATIPNGRQWIDESSNVATLAPGNVLLGDLSADFPLLSPNHPDKHPDRHPLRSMGKLPPPHRVEGRVAVLSGLLNDVYFHWMMDLLPRLHLLQRSGIALEEVDYFLVNHRLPFQQESLQRFGIPLVKTLEPSQYPHLQATELIVPSFPASPSWMPRWACDVLRHTFLPHAPEVEASDRLYISRGKTTTRRLINEAEVVTFLESQGFQAVTTESLSIGEQVALFAQAQIVIAPHGSGLTNLVFCNPGTRVIELFSPYYVYPCYWLISNWMGLKYAYLTGQVPEGEHLHQLFYTDARLEDLWIEVEDLRSLLQTSNS